MRQIHQRQHFCHPRLTFGSRHALHLQAIGDVLRHVERREQRVVLKHHADVAFLNRQRGNIPLIKPDFTWRIAAFQTADDTQQCGFSAAGWPQQNQRFSGVDPQIERMQRDLLIEATRAVAQRHVDGLFHRVSSLCCRADCRSSQ